MSDTRTQPPSKTATAPDTGKNEGVVQKAAAAPPPAAASGSNLVKVGCKLPHGLILTEEVKVEDKFVATGKRTVLQGYNSAKVIGGCGITEVDRDFITHWLEANKAFAPVVEGLIFVVGSDDEAEKEAARRETVRSGFEAPQPGAPGTNLEPVPQPGPAA